MSWRCGTTLDRLIVTGQMEELIVIGVDNTPDRIDELTYSYDPEEKAGGKGKHMSYLHFNLLIRPCRRLVFGLSCQNCASLGSRQTSCRYQAQPTWHPWVQFRRTHQLLCSLDSIRCIWKGCLHVEVFFNPPKTGVANCPLNFAFIQFILVEQRRFQ